MDNDDLVKNLEFFFKSINKDDYELCVQKLKLSIDKNELTHSRLNQILHLFHEAGHSEGFFKYYFVYEEGNKHLYEKSSIKGFSSDFVSGDSLTSEQLLWGIRCYFTDALLIFGNIRSAYREWRGMTKSELKDYFSKRCFDTENLMSRKEGLEMENIEKDDRYFLSEILTAYIVVNDISNDLKRLISLGSQDDNLKAKSDKTDKDDLTMLKDILIPKFSDKTIKSSYTEENLLAEIKKHHKKIQHSGKINNKLYLSQSNDIDIYIATSMRSNKQHMILLKHLVMTNPLLVCH